MTLVSIAAFAGVVYVRGHDDNESGSRQQDESSSYRPPRFHRRRSGDGRRGADRAISRVRRISRVSSNCSGARVGLAGASAELVRPITTRCPVSGADSAGPHSRSGQRPRPHRPRRHAPQRRARGGRRRSARRSRALRQGIRRARRQYRQARRQAHRLPVGLRVEDARINRGVRRGRARICEMDGSGRQISARLRPGRSVRN